MKRLFKVLSGMSLFACLLLVLFACGDNENVSKPDVDKPEISIPGDRTPFVVTDLLGTLSYDETEKAWTISPDREQPGLFIQLGDSESLYMIVSKMKKEYESLAGRISFSGKVTPKHDLLYEASVVVHVYTIELSNISSIEEDHK